MNKDTVVLSLSEYDRLKKIERFHNELEDNKVIYIDSNIRVLTRDEAIKKLSDDLGKTKGKYNTLISQLTSKTFVTKPKKKWFNLFNL